MVITLRQRYSTKPENALNDLSAYFTGGHTIPRTKISGDNINASDLNNLVSAMDSIV